MGIEELLGSLCVFALIRSAPFAFYAVGAGLGWRQGVVVSGAFVASVWGTARWAAVGSVAWLLAAAFYYLFVCLLLHLGGRYLWRVRSAFGRALLFASLFALSIVVPAALWPMAPTFAFIIGWEFALRGFSYVVESRKGAARPTLTECLFFTLVDPSVYYPFRAVRGSNVPWTMAALRMALGFGLVAVNAAALRPFTDGLVASTSASFDQRVPLVGLIYMASLYVVHSGLAHFQLGAMALCGWSARERYDWPLLAGSPREFWQRWNTYIQVWLEAYLFLPIAAVAARWSRGRSSVARYVARAAAISAAFLGSGLLHDLQGMLDGRGVRFTPVFGFAAVATGLWFVSGKVAQKVFLGPGCHAVARVVRPVAMVGTIAIGGVVLRYSV